MLPPYIDKSCNSQGERIVFNILKNSPFTRNWTVLHSLNLAEHCKRLYGEIDFLLLIPNGGIFVMEVKGGNVKCKDGVWEFTNRYGKKNKNKSPFSQASDAMFSLMSAIHRKFGMNHQFSRIQFGFFVSFPQIHFDVRSVEYEPWQIHDRDTIEVGSELFFENLIKNFAIKHKNESWFSEKESLPEKVVLEDLCHFLRGDFERVRTIAETLRDFESQVKSYTDEQFEILDSVHLNRHCLIQGIAGTGKTMVAIESAIRAAHEGKSVFLTCFNRLIGEWMATQVKDEENITVSHLHGYLLEKSKGFNYDTTTIDDDTFFKSYLPELLKEIFNKGIVRKFDKLIIDEGQDLIREEYLNLFDSMIHGGLTKGNWEIFGDFERQAIYSSISKDAMMSLINNKARTNPTYFSLRKNCRNTKQIAEETSMVSGFERPPHVLEHLEGISVQYLFYKDKFEVSTMLEEQINLLLQSGMRTNDIVVLSPRKYEYSSISSITKYPIREIRSLKEFVSDTNTIYFSTAHSFKGMESKYVIVIDVEDITSEKAKSILYIAMSRAKYGLIMFVAEEQRENYRLILQRNLS